jgi:hypothetical protein
MYVILIVFSFFSVSFPLELSQLNMELHVDLMTGEVGVPRGVTSEISLQP